MSTPAKPRFAPKPAVAQVAKAPTVQKPNNSAARLAKLVKAAEVRGPPMTREEEFLEEGGDPEELQRWGDPDEVFRLLGSYTGNYGVERRGDDEFTQPKLDAHALATKFPKPPPVVFSSDPAERSRLASGCAGLDCETKLIQPGRNTPTLVVTGYQAADGVQTIVGGDAGDPARHAKAFLAFANTALRERVLVLNQNLSFDLCVIAESAHQADVALGLVGKLESWFEAVMSKAFELLDSEVGCEDTILRERLVDLAEGTLGRDFASLTAKGTPRKKRYTLASLAHNYLAVDLDKFTFRLSYHRLLNVPVADYPEGARKYVVDDVESCLQVATQQQVRAGNNELLVDRRIPNSAEQTKAAFALQLVSSWGMRTDLQSVQKLDAELDHWQRKLEYVLKESGLIRKTGAGAGSRDMKMLHGLVKKYYEEAGLEVPMTKSGQNISTKGSVLEDIALIRLRGSSEDVLLEDGTIDETELMNEPLYAYSQAMSIQKLQSSYLPALYSGVDKPINTRFETLLETGRISSYKPNLNNLPRGGKKTILLKLQSKVRECFVPRPGFVFCSTDYSALELCTLAQSVFWLFGKSTMAEAINDGMDLHTLFAANQLLHMPYAEALSRKKEPRVKDMRQLSKVANFGLMANAGAQTFVEFAKQSYNCYIVEEEAKTLKQKWLEQWPEMPRYFAHGSAMMKGGYDDFGKPVGTVNQFYSNRIRGRARYCAFLNSLPQGLAADGSKEALYELQKVSYLQNGSLSGSRSVAFLYDEFIMEHPEETAAERAQIQADIAVRVMQAVCPDVKISAEPALMRRWLKEAEPVYKDGRLVPWEPESKAA